MSLSISAFDLSLECTGIASRSSDGAVDVSVLKTDSKLPMGERLHMIASLVRQHAERADLVLVEAPVTRSFAATTSGMIHGAIRCTLYAAALPEPLQVSPASIQKYGSGVGRGDKTAMVAAAIRRLDYQGSNHNEADALWLLAMACDHYGFALAPMPASHRVALDKIAWPALVG